MHIVTGSDDNYVSGVLVLIASAVWHNPSARFTVLDMGISTQNRWRIDALADRLAVQIQRVEINESTFSKLIVKRSHLNRSAYLRLLIPDVLKGDDRVTYMDCDMVVTGSIEALDRVELGDAPVAAVACPSPDPRELRDTGVDLGEYINSGLLIMNLPTWRREGLAEKCMSLLSDTDVARWCEDQSAINILCKGRIKILDPRYNVYANEPTYRTAPEVPSDISVLHYVVNVKPWLWRVPFGEIWQFHADQISDLMPPSKRKNLSQLMIRLEAHRRMAFGLAMGRKKHWNRLKVRRAIMNRVVLPYLEAQRGRLG